MLDWSFRRNSKNIQQLIQRGKVFFKCVLCLRAVLLCLLFYFKKEKKNTFILEINCLPSSACVLLRCSIDSYWKKINIPFWSSLFFLQDQLNHNLQLAVVTSSHVRMCSSVCLSVQNVMGLKIAWMEVMKLIVPQ